MAYAKIVDNHEKVLFIFGCKKLFYLGSEILKDIRQVPYRLPTIIHRCAMATVSEDCGINSLHDGIVRGWNICIE